MTWDGKERRDCHQGCPALTKSDITDIAENAADKAVHKVFLFTGTDLGVPGEVSALQKDRAFTRRQREASEQFGPMVRRAGLAAGIGMAVTGGAWLFWETVKNTISSG